jgi:hypothetical protein
MEPGQRLGNLPSGRVCARHSGAGVTIETCCIMCVLDRIFQPIVYYVVHV